MSTNEQPTWNCPICSLKRLLHGAICPTWATGCEGAKTPNITGAWYLRNRINEDVQSMGIAAISDEGKQTDV